MGADISQLLNKPVLLQNDHGHFINVQGANTFGHSKNTGTWEQWVLESDGKTGVFINNVGHDLRLGAQDNKSAVITTKNRDAWERWSFESSGDRFYIKSHFGTYLNQGADGRVIQSPNRGGSELFRVIPLHGAVAPVAVPHVQGVVHMSGVGDVAFNNSQFGGTKGQSRALEGFSLALNPALPDVGLEYSCHAANVGDMAWTSTGNFQGSRGQSRQIEGITIRLTGAGASRYIVKYIVHMAGKGDSAVATGGQYCGTRGESRAIEGIHVWLEPAAVPVAAPSTSRGRFYFTSAHNSQLSAGDKGTFSASPNKAGWEVFTIHDAGNGRVLLSTAHGTQLSCSDTHVLSQSPNKAGWEQWTLTPAGNGKWYIVAHTGNHLGMGDNGSLYCNNRNTGGWEQWAITSA